MKKFISFLVIVALIVIGALEYDHRQLLDPLVQSLSKPKTQRVVPQQKQTPNLKAPGDASRMTKRVVTKGPIHYHGFFNSKNQSAYLRQIRYYALQDINQERNKRHLQPLKLNRPLNRVATMRSVQADRNFNHYNQNGQVLACSDAAKLKVSPSYFTARAHISECLSEQAGNVDNTAKQVAGTAIKGMIYHDAGSHWGHRKILLSPKNRYVGIAAHYDKAKNNKVVVAYDLFQP